MNEIAECLKDTEHIDHVLHQTINHITPEAASKEIVALLRAGIAKPGRASKLQATYILERCAEAVHDIRDACLDPKEETRLDMVMDLVDQGISAAANLVDPTSDGKWLAKFDQTVVPFRVPGPKPKISKLILLPE